MSGKQMPEILDSKMPLDHGSRQISKLAKHAKNGAQQHIPPYVNTPVSENQRNGNCLLYTSDAADE